MSFFCRIQLVVCLVTLLVFSACRRPDVVPYDQLLSGLTNLQSIASLDRTATVMISSADRTGANEDYNHFQGKTKDGQFILADLKGPGVMDRFWYTGAHADEKVRFYFDDSIAPDMEFSWNSLVSGFPPFDTPPVSIAEQNCWYTYLPIPFARRLLITTEDLGYTYGGTKKMYYQLNWHPLPHGQTVESLALPMTPEHRRILENIAEVWQGMDFGVIPPADKMVSIPAGQSVALWQGNGPATLQAFSLTPDFAAIKSALQRDCMLRDVLLQIHWDELDEPSVNVPLGDFFGSVWQRWRSESMYFGSRDNTFFSRFPMPFKTSARVSLVNPTAYAFSVKFGVTTAPRIEGGYFHAGWRNSPASATGTPHAVLKAEGLGRFAGCMLSVVSADRSFWVLESDESMVIDGQKAWQGTGLEDYFNGGWYYANVFSRPLQGLPIKAPFRTVQYRLHLSDAVMFDKTFSMEFERGPANNSHADYESVSYYYMEHPQSADGSLENRDAPVDGVRPYTMMTDLWNFERFGDLQGEVDYIDFYQEQFNPPFAETLAMRKLACRLEKGELTRSQFLDALQPFGQSTNTVARRQCEALKALYSVKGTALIQFYANMQSELYLDGERILAAGDPQQPVFTTVTLASGRHVLAAASAAQQYPLWTQVAVSDANGFLLGTSSDWKHAINPTGPWSTVNYDDSGWWDKFTGADGRVKGPPEEPYVWVNPDPFVNTLSAASGLRPSAPWPDKKGRVVFRKVFEIP